MIDKDMHFKNISKIDSAIAYIFFTFILFVLLVIVIDLYQFYQKPSDYASVYKSNDSSDWITNYINGGIKTIVYLLLILGLTFWRLINPHKVLRLLVGSIYIIIFIALVIGLYRWSVKGFDH